MWHWCNLAANESRLECACVNNDDFAVLVSGSSRHCWVSLCTYVAVTFKMTGRVEQQVCLQFCIKLEHSSTKTISVIQKPTAGDWQLHHDNVPTHASCLRQNFLVKHQITQVTQPPYSPDLAPCDFWLFPKLKSPLKGKRFQTVDEIQENATGQLMENGRTVWGPKVPTLRGPRHHCPLYNTSWILYLQ